VTKDRAWLASTMESALASYRTFAEGKHSIEKGLSRYYDEGHGPAPEVLASERDAQGRTHYDRVKEYFRTHTITDYDVGQFYDRKNDRLTEHFYDADRAMRESGFDPSGRFGPFNAAILDYAPVCLNSLLYLMEVQLGEMEKILGRGGDEWAKRAKARAATIDRLMWDEQRGMYFDYDYVHRHRRIYPFATTFYPLWVGLASPARAKRVVESMKILAAPGGLLTSTVETGTQWDAPYGWAPLQLIAFEALKKYGYDKEAEQLGADFVSTVFQGFVEHGAIFEKYDVAHRRADVQKGIRFGYSTNEIGFGWTNAAVVEIWHALSDLGKKRATQIE
jgi:alpha,alpha-trehalase